MHFLLVKSSNHILINLTETVIGHGNPLDQSVYTRGRMGQNRSRFHQVKSKVLRCADMDALRDLITDDRFDVNRYVKILTSSIFIDW